MKKSIITFTICFLILFDVTSTFSSTADDVRAGNELFEKKQYDKAVEEYSKAKDNSPDTDILSFNTGTALYKQGKFEEAIDAFTNSLITEDRELEAMANYNIANSKFRLGSNKKQEDLSAAIHLYRQSLDHYKRAIELDETNDDARYNHELVEKRMKVLLDRLKNQQEQEKEEEDEKGEGQKEAKDQQAGNEESEQGKEEQESESDQPEDNGQQEEARQEHSAEEQADSGKSAGPEGEQGEEMTPEEANMLLEAFGDEESLDTLEKRGRAQFRGVLKNW